MSRAIIFPGGAGGNHLRWLLYLDKSIDSDLSMDKKIDFVLNKIYSDQRSFYNWLPYEATWRFDDKFESFIKILHEPKDDKPEYKSVFLSYDDWNIPFEHYSCLTSCFSSKRSYDLYYNFLKDFDRKVSKLIVIDENKLVIKSDVFFNEVLDKQFYTQIVDFFDFENHYDEAAILHKKWYDTRNRAKKEFYEFYSSKFWQDFMARMRGDVQRNKGLLP
jgi:hypothetical protein